MFGVKLNFLPRSYKTVIETRNCLMCDFYSDKVTSNYLEQIRVLPQNQGKFAGQFAVKMHTLETSHIGVS